MATLSQMLSPGLLSALRAQQQMGSTGQQMRGSSAPGAMARPQATGMSPQAMQLQQLAQRFGQPATSPQFNAQAFQQQQQQAQQQRWAQLMQQLGRNPAGPGGTAPMINPVGQRPATPAPVAPPGAGSSDWRDPYGRMFLNMGGGG